MCPVERSSKGRGNRREPTSYQHAEHRTIEPEGARTGAVSGDVCPVGAWPVADNRGARGSIGVGSGPQVEAETPVALPELLFHFTLKASAWTAIRPW